MMFFMLRNFIAQLLTHLCSVRMGIISLANGWYSHSTLLWEFIERIL